jgi:uracil-DNA glycosylase family 4
MTSSGLDAVAAEIVACRSCPRLVAWREDRAAHPRRAFVNERYWGRAIPGFGDPAATLGVVGLAPAANGGNRTGRIFTGDPSGDWLYRALYRAGYANQPESVGRDDGLELRGAYVTAAVRCAPPDNKPTTTERNRCVGYLAAELRELVELRVILVLGGFAYDALARVTGGRGRPRFGHLVEWNLPETSPLAGGRTVLCSYHPSQRNTATRTLTEEMFDAVFARARELGA